MAQNQKSYDNEFKAQAVKLAQEIGGHKAANELGIPKGTMYTWIKAFKEGRLSANEAVHTPKNALSLNDELCEQTLDNACRAYPMLRGAILHSDRGTQYTSELYRKAINKYGILQSMNSAGGRCDDNARCESMWARFKEELLYRRYDTNQMTV